MAGAVLTGGRRARHECLVITRMRCKATSFMAWKVSVCQPTMPASIRSFENLKVTINQKTTTKSCNDFFTADTFHISSVHLTDQKCHPELTCAPTHARG